jgi:hypothetical protein
MYCKHNVDKLIMHTELAGGRERRELVAGEERARGGFCSLNTACCEYFCFLCRSLCFVFIFGEEDKKAGTWCTVVASSVRRSSSIKSDKETR